MNLENLKNVITLGDCMDYMAEMPDNYIDLAVVDPPYGIGNFVQCTGKIRGDRVLWNDNIPDKKYFNELKRVSKNKIIWGANYYNCFDGKNGAIVWVKNQPMPKFSQAEIASCSFHKKVSLVNITWTNYVNTKNTKHPAEKPVALYRWILQNYAKPGQLILDTHSGSGSCACACHLEGFDFIAIELDEDYHRDSVVRLDELRSQGRLFT